MIGRWCLLFIVAAVVLASCSTERERQWYKPASNYTMDEFKRDRDGCTKGNTLDEQCMKELGWVPLTSDRPVETAPKPPPAKGRY
ncbi:MAG TPA: hypothetical protein VL086_19515 [Candidatus Nitrosotalea sp.]|nr:hypothetical protein [Candidatus Nitrosotalea sp.]